MTGGRVMFSEIVSIVVSARFPMDEELALAYHTVTNPIEAHVDGLGSALLGGVVGNAGIGDVIGLPRCGWLGVVKFEESSAKGR
jgi:hypothetical protein